MSHYSGFFVGFKGRSSVASKTRDVLGSGVTQTLAGNYRRLLGLDHSWKVRDVKLQLEAKRVAMMFRGYLHGLLAHFRHRPINAAVEGHVPRRKNRSSLMQLEFDTFAK